MRRLIQVGTLIFLLVTFLTPVLEWFDRWDASGLGNDSEFAVFVLCFALCLVLVVLKLLSALGLKIGAAWQRLTVPEGQDGRRDSAGRSALRPPLLVHPLRI